MDRNDAFVLLLVSLCFSLLQRTDTVLYVFQLSPQNFCLASQEFCLLFGGKWWRIGIPIPCSCPPGQRGCAEPIAPSPASAETAEATATTQSKSGSAGHGIHRAGHSEARTISRSSSCPWPEALRTCSITKWHCYSPPFRRFLFVLC
jgi:hypothetical protein